MNDIKIKHYLNKKLKPKINNGVNHYCVYFRFNLEGKNHRIPSFFVTDYLASDKELNSYSLEMKEEEYFINLLYKSKDDYEFKSYFFDIQQIALSIKDILQDIMKTADGSNIHSDFLYSLSSYMEDYKKDFIESISEKYKYSLEFVESFFRIAPLGEHDFYPTNFIKNQEVKDFFEAYNKIMEFSEERLIHEYDWVKRNQSEVFKAKFGEKYYKIIDRIVRERLKDKVL